MLGLEALQARMARVESLRSVVRTMKAMAMANQRNVDQAQHAITATSATAELALQAVLQLRRFCVDGVGPMPWLQPPKSDAATLVVLFGSDHGLCGAFNEQIAAYANQSLQQLNPPAQQLHWLLVGSRLAPLMVAQGLESNALVLAEPLALPVSLAGVPRLIHQLMETIPTGLSSEPTTWQTPPGRVVLVHHQPAAQVSYAPCLTQLVPLDPLWLAELEARPWASPSRPAASGPWEGLVAQVVADHLAIALHQAAVASLASENSARLMAMHAAEANIDERLALLQQQYLQVRQGVITDELLDIVSGYEALRQHNGNR